MAADGIERSIREFMGDPAAERGFAYARQGRVIAWEVHADGTRVTGAVQGQEAAPYVQEIALKWGAGGRLVLIDGDCTCPVEVNCKHVAAVLQAARPVLEPQSRGAAGQGARPRPDASRPDASRRERLSGALSVWLEGMPKAQLPDGEADDYGPRVRDRILHVLSVEDRTLRVTPWKVSLLKDGSVGGQRRIYDHRNVDPDRRPKFVRDADLQIWRLLRLSEDRYFHRDGRPLPPGPEGERVLSLILSSQRGRWEDLDAPPLSEGPDTEGRFVWREARDGLQRLVVETAAGAVLHPLPLRPLWYVDPDTGRCGRLATDQPEARAAWLAVAPPVPAREAAALDRELAGIAGAPRPRAIRREVVTGRAPRPVLHLSAVPARAVDHRDWRRPLHGAFRTGEIAPALQVLFDYGGRRIAATEPRQELEVHAGDAVQLWQRSRDDEATFLEQIDARAQACGFRRAGDLRRLLSMGLEAAGGWLLWPFDVETPISPGGGGLEALGFLDHVVPDLRAAGWRVEIDASWPLRFHEGEQTIRAGVTEDDGGWFSMALKVEVDGQEVDLLPVLLRFVKGLPAEALEPGFDLAAHVGEQRFLVETEPGRFLATPIAPFVPALRLFLALQAQMHEAEAGVIPEIAEALKGAGIPFEGGDRLLTLGERLRALATPEAAPPPPEGFNGDLRPYQRTGLGWMLALSETGFGGILADDMGLGKTVQTLAFLTAKRRTGQPPDLLIVPTSLVGTWAREAARFAPGLRVLALHGPDRKADFDRIGEADLVITTYPLLHRDHAALFAQPWDCIVLDEAQAVRNPTSRAAKLIRTATARHRLALTGTPMDNDLGELWTLYDWLVPGLLGDRKRFEAETRRPIEKQGDPAARARLARRIAPFLLRRTKDAVAADLPPKTEITETVDLTGPQRVLYETVRLAMDRRVREALAARGLAGSRITVLDALLKLRQVCCDPALVKLPAARSVTASAKRAHLMEMLEQLMAEGRRVLVFSQFVGMLRLIEADIRARGWSHVWLTGETTDRAAVVEAFQRGDAPIFLISLKAGGVGLTLTAADTVILYDPWWNPGVERQAMDRTHRIGQDKPVFVHRLIAAGTVETRILQIQARKQALADSLFDPTATGPAALTEDDILSLFQPLDRAED